MPSTKQRAAMVDGTVGALCAMVSEMPPADRSLALALALVGVTRHDAAEAVPGLPLGDPAIERMIREKIDDTIHTAHHKLAGDAAP